MPLRANVEAEAKRLTIAAGLAIRSERLRRGLAIRGLAELSGLAPSTVYAAESGRSAAVETYVRLALALRLRPELLILDPRKRSSNASREEDPLHAAMGECLARHFRGLGFEVGLDEPFQHFQFAGRADFVAFSRPAAALLHVENKTRLPNIQDAFGSFNAKRSYLGAELAERFGVGRWRTETHVLMGVWSGEMLYRIRLNRASVASVCADGPGVFERWWSGLPPGSGKQTTLILLDPGLGLDVSARPRSPVWIGGDEVDGLRPRYRDYAHALDSVMGTVGRRNNR